jgi:hypothetical protein
VTRCPTLEPSCQHSSQVADTPQTKLTEAPQAAEAPLLLLLDSPSTEPRDKMAFPHGRVSNGLGNVERYDNNVKDRKSLTHDVTDPQISTPVGISLFICNIGVGSSPALDWCSELFWKSLLKLRSSDARDARNHRATIASRFVSSNKRLLEEWVIHSVAALSGPKMTLCQVL